MSDTYAQSKLLVSKRELTNQERELIVRFKQKSSRNSPEFFRANAMDNKESLELSLDPDLSQQDSKDLMNAHLLASTGNANNILSLRSLTSLAKACIPKDFKGSQLADELNGLALSMQTLGPQDEYEGQLVSQLVLLHEHALQLLGKAMRTERIDFANVYLNGASKLLCRHHETLETLLKYRRKGEQRVHVEHVHVHDGGQAIVGSVTTGGGRKPKIEEGPHAKV